MSRILPKNADQDPGSRPPSLDVRLIQASVWAVRQHPRWLIFFLVLLALIGLLRQGLYTVPTNKTGALFQFGALLRDDVTAGIHFKLPAPIQQVRIVNTSEMRHMSLSGPGMRAVSLVTADAYLIDIDVALQYRITSLGQYLLDCEDWETLLRLTLISELSRQVSQMGVDEVLTTGKSSVQLKLRSQAQKKLDALQSGLTLISTKLVFVRPPAEAAGAFRRVSDARAEQSRLLSEAQAGRSKMLSQTRGQVAKMMREAESTAKERVLKAQGDAQRYAELRRAYQLAKAVGRTDLYTQKIKQVLGRARLVLLDPKSQRALDLNIFNNDKPTKLNTTK